MRTSTRAAAVTAVTLALGAAPASAVEGGSATFLSAADVDYIDPGQTYYTFGYMVHYAVNRTLYGLRPGTVNPVPDLATAAPEVAADNRSLTVHLRPGVRYSPPVNREMRSADIKYAIERGFSKQVPSGYARTYFAEITGAPSRPGPIRDIAGIETPDDRTLVLRLDRPVGQRVAAALVMPITTPVPEEYAAPFDRKNPSTYDEHVAFTGPYMVRNDAAGNLIGHNPGEEIELVRNPSWDRATDFRPAHLDTISIQEGNDDLTAASRRTLQGSRLLCCDSGAPPIAVLKGALRDSPAQVGRAPGGGTRWIALNTRIAPFNNINVRKAVIAGFDREALRATRGGKQVGPIAQHFLPPGIPGFEESGGAGGFKELDFMANPSGNRKLAAAYMRKAGYPKGRYTGRKRLLTVATNADPGARTAALAKRQFERLGFRLRFGNVPQDTLYTRFCGVPRARVAICPNVGWFKDFNDPEPMLAPTFSGDAITSSGNVNWSQLRIASIDRLMRTAAEIPPGGERNRAWADINRRIVANAPGIPYVWDENFQLASRDVDAVMNPYSGGWDLSFTQLR